MIDSTLSPRLSHLLIQEDSMTGRLLMPDGTDAREPMGGLSPPLTPSTSTFAFEASPLHKSARLPSPLEPNALFNSLRLPPPTALPYRRSQQSASLLSILSTSPPDSADSSFSFVRPASAGQRLAPPSSHSSRPMSSRAVPPSPPPTVFVARSASMRPSWSGPGQFGPSSFGSGLRPLTSAPLSSSFPNRPQGFVRRESVMSDIPPPTPYSRPNTSPYPMPSGAQRFHAGHGVEEGMGSRAPISRTTKACNACRTRKVRCDAGGLPGGQPGTCSRCRESGVDCVYSVIQKKRGPCPGSIRGSGPKPRRQSSNRAPAETEKPHRRRGSSFDELTARAAGVDLSSHAASLPSQRPTTSRGWSSAGMPRSFSSQSERNQGAFENRNIMRSSSPPTSSFQSRRTSEDSTTSDSAMPRTTADDMDMDMDDLPARTTLSSIGFSREQPNRPPLAVTIGVKNLYYQLGSP